MAKDTLKENHMYSSEPRIGIGINSFSPNLDKTRFTKLPANFGINRDAANMQRKPNPDFARDEYIRAPKNNMTNTMPQGMPQILPQSFYMMHNNARYNF